MGEQQKRRHRNPTEFQSDVPRRRHQLTSHTYIPHTPGNIFRFFPTPHLPVASRPPSPLRAPPALCASRAARRPSQPYQPRRSQLRQQDRPRRFRSAAFRHGHRPRSHPRGASPAGRVSALRAATLPRSGSKTARACRSSRLPYPQATVHRKVGPC